MSSIRFAGLVAAALGFAPALFAAGAGAVSAGLVRCQPFTASPLPTPVLQTDPHAVERFRVINKEVKSGPYAVLFLGDSLTEKWAPAIWERHFAKLGALNEGVNGDRTEHLLWRLEHGNLDGPSPKVVIVLVGTNDIGRNRPPDVIAEGVREILEVLRSRLPTARILLLGVLPRSESPASKRRRQVHEVNQLIRECADGKQIVYADVGDALLDRAGRLLPEVSPDGVHLSPEGYRLLAQRLDVELDRLLAAEPGEGRR